jgi:putative flippase GtrA
MPQTPRAVYADLCSPVWRGRAVLEAELQVPIKTADNVGVLELRGETRHWGRQFPRFLAVGVGNTVVSFVAYRLLIAVDVWYVVAAPVAFGVGAINGYVFNRRWTFAARDSLRARLLYVAVAVAGAASTSAIVLLCVRGLGTGRVIAYLIAIPPVTVGTFLANRVWTFRS